MQCFKIFFSCLELSDKWSGQGEVKNPDFQVDPSRLSDVEEDRESAASI